MGIKGIRTMHIILIAIAMAGCAGKKSEPTDLTRNDAWNTQKLLKAAESSAYSSMKERNRGKAKDIAKKGIEYAERCLMHSPESAGCYYWRAVNTGLYYKIRVIGYQRGIKQMIEDCHRIIEIDPQYDYAGAYRILGRIYTQLPQTGAHAESTTRDLHLAEEYLRKAIQIAPEYPENFLALADTLLDGKRTSEAMEALINAKDLAPQWKDEVAYSEWKEEMRGLERKIAKALPTGRQEQNR